MGGPLKRKRVNSPEVDAAIRDAFSEGAGVEKTFRNIVLDTGWPDTALRRRAKELGIYQPAPEYWDEREIEIMRASGSQCRTVTMQRKLEAAGFRRSVPAVRNKRRELGIPNPPRPIKWKATPAVDEAIREAFLQKKKGTGAVRLAMDALGWPRNAIERRAIVLGLSHPRDWAEWTEAEEKILAEMPFQSLKAIKLNILRRLGVHRTESAINAKRQRMKLLCNLDGMSLTGVANALGVASETVRRWLDRGKIQAILRFPELQHVGGHVWYFPNTEIRRFVLANLAVIDLTKVEKYWFVDLLANGKAPK